MNARSASSHRVGRLVLGLVSGLLFGLGLAAMLVSYSVVALGTRTPLVVVAVVVVVGIALGAIPKRHGTHPARA